MAATENNKIKINHGLLCLSCAFNIPPRFSALDNMDTFYAFHEFCWSWWEKQVQGRWFAQSGPRQDISCSPAITVSLSCVFMTCDVLCHCSPGHFVCVCVLCKQGPNNYWNCIWSYPSAVTAKPSVEHKKPLNKTYRAPLTGSLHIFRFKVLYFSRCYS